MIIRIHHTAAVRAVIHTRKAQVVIHQVLHQARLAAQAASQEVHQERLAVQAVHQNQVVQEAHQSEVQSQAVQRAVQKRSIMIHMMMVTMTFIWMVIMITTDIIKIQTMQMV